MLLGRGQDGNPKSLEQALGMKAPTPTIEPASPKFLAVSKHLARKAKLLPPYQKLRDGEPSFPNLALHGGFFDAPKPGFKGFQSTQAVKDLNHSNSTTTE